jgi:hypothetical protein
LRGKLGLEFIAGKQACILALDGVYKSKGDIHASFFAG